MKIFALSIILSSEKSFGNVMKFEFRMRLQQPLNACMRFRIPKPVGCQMNSSRLSLLKR